MLITSVRFLYFQKRIYLKNLSLSSSYKCLSERITNLTIFVTFFIENYRSKKINNLQLITYLRFLVEAFSHVFFIKCSDLEKFFLGFLT